MTKFKVVIGENFEIYDVPETPAVPEVKQQNNGVTVVVVPDKRSDSEPNKKPPRPHLITLLTTLVGIMLALSMVGSYAYGVATGDYSLLKAFPELINKLLSKAVDLMAAKK